LPVQLQDVAGVEVRRSSPIHQGFEVTLSIRIKANNLAVQHGVSGFHSAAAMAALAIACADSGNGKEATSILRNLEAASKSRYIASLEIAAILASLSQTDHMFEALQMAYDNHEFQFFYLKADPRVDRLHSDVRYADLLRRMRLPQ
jgi:hypothetical protein